MYIEYRTPSCVSGERGLIILKASDTKIGTFQRKPQGWFPRTDATVLNHTYLPPFHEVF